MTMPTLTEIDLDALRRSIEIDRRRNRARRRQVDARLAAGEDWGRVARSCSFNCQIDAMALQPWESTLAYADTPEAHALVRRLKAAGLSRYEPDPLGALEKVGRNGLPGETP
ncbi:hypothetical protein [Bradyrhizobium sp. RT4b]|uniref:hypothetical protein n=1 Tax=Bradyrhizobium sp. RT4b TaxID=3156379 RepID=UPI0033954776